METSSITSKILQILSSRYDMSCSLEELTQLIIPNDGSSILSGEITATEKENQAAVLETLIQLDSQGLIFLDSDADRSVITTKGMLKVHNRILCN